MQSTSLSGKPQNGLSLASPLFTCPVLVNRASLVAQMVKNLPAIRRPGFDPWVRKIPWRREWQPTPVFLPEESHGQRSWEGHSPWAHKESDMAERLTLSLDFAFLLVNYPEAVGTIFLLNE